MRSFVSDSSASPRSGAVGRRRGRQAGPKAGSEERSGAEGSPRHTLSESVPERWRAQFRYVGNTFAVVAEEVKQVVGILVLAANVKGESL